jgi:hypothetical protein
MGYIDGVKEHLDEVEARRRSFLEPLLAALGLAHGDALNSFFDVIDESRGLGLSIAFEGEPGMAQIAAVEVEHGVIRYAAFGSGGKPHYQLAIYAEGAEFAHTFRTTCNPDVVLEAIAAWRATARPPAAAPLPLSEADRNELRAIARARTVVGTLDVRVTPFAERVIAAEDRLRLRDDVASISREALFASFPRADDGRLTLGETVLLARYAPAGELSKGREPWLVALGPERKKDGAVVRVEVATPITTNEPHAWQDARWLWDARAGAADAAVRWGVEPGDRRANECLALLDEGRFEKAFRIYGVTLSEMVLRILARQPASAHDAGFADAWRESMKRALWRVAPWRLESVIAAAPRKKRDKDETWIRLFGLPGQRHQRKASLMLVGGPPGREMRLEVDWTGSNERLPLVRWTRPIDHDVVRLGIL